MWFLVKKTRKVVEIEEGANDLVGRTKHLSSNELPLTSKATISLQPQSVEAMEASVKGAHCL